MNEIVTRALSGVVYIALIIGGLYFGKTSWLLTSSLFFVLGLREWIALKKKAFPKKESYSSIFLGVLFFGSLGFWILEGNPPKALPLALLAGVVLVGHVVYFYTNKPRQSFLSVFTYLALPLGLGLLLPFQGGEYSPFILISIFAAIWANDTFAYLVGRAIGKHPLSPKYSPKKTVEGFAGGVIGSFLVLAIMQTQGLFIEANIFELILPSLLISLAATFGDLLESKIKRLAGVKDSGNIMPGHGGILDRLDSYLFVAPLLYLYLTLFN